MLQINYSLGAKLLALKEQLQVKMKAKREEARQKRQEVFDMDNEEGFGEEAILDNEDEMSEHTDTDVEEDEEFEKQFGDEEEEEMKEVISKSIGMLTFNVWCHIMNFG